MSALAQETQTAPPSGSRTTVALPMEHFILSPPLFLQGREARRAEPRRSDERPDRGDESRRPGDPDHASAGRG